MTKELPPVDEKDRPYGLSGYKGADAKELARRAGLARPVAMTEEKFMEACDRLVEGEPLVLICADLTMPSRRHFMRYLRDNEKAKELYHAAQEMRMETLAEEAMLIAYDDSNDSSKGPKGRIAHNDVVQRSRLKVDTIWRTAAAFAPKRFSTKTTTEIQGNANQPVILQVKTGIELREDSLISAPKIIEGSVVKND